MIFIKHHCSLQLCDLCMQNLSLALESLVTEPELGLSLHPQRSQHSFLYEICTKLYLYLFNTQMIVSCQLSFFHHIWPEQDWVICAFWFVMECDLCFSYLLGSSYFWPPLLQRQAGLWSPVPTVSLMVAKIFSVCWWVRLGLRNEICGVWLSLCLLIIKPTLLIINF